MGVVPNELDADVSMACCRREDVSTQNENVYSILCRVDTQMLRLLFVDIVSMDLNCKGKFKVTRST